MLRKPEPDARLRTAADFVRQDAVFADVGTDHAYLPVFLLLAGRIRRAYACDIAPGPLARAEENVRKYGLADKVTLRLTDGLAGLEGEGLTDIAICGMGGEVMVSILSAAPFVRDGGVRLILQPNSRAAVLRRYLCAEGFAIEEERTVKAGDKLYFCLCCTYTGQRTVLTKAEAELGPYNLAHPGAAFAELVERRSEAAQKRLAGLHAGGITDPEEEAYAAFLANWRMHETD